MAILDIYINGEKIEMRDNEKIVQSFSIINIADITKRFGEYSNEFKIPKTNNNIRILGYANYLNSTTLLPYARIKCDIYTNGFLFKQGFVELVAIDSDISLRFYTGNVTFYDTLKAGKLSSLRLSDLDHHWDLSTVVSSRVNTSGYTYPLIDYGAMSTSGSTVDARQLLPAYFDPTIVEALCVENGYTLVNNLSGDKLDEFNKGIVPTAKKSPSIPNETLLANVYEGVTDGGGYENSQSFSGLTSGQTIVWTQGPNSVRFPVPVNNPSNLYSIYNNLNFGNGTFTATVAGLYKVKCKFTWDFNWSELWNSSPVKTTNVYVSFDAYVNGIPVVNMFSSSYSTSVTFPTDYSFSGSYDDTIYVFLGEGDQLTLKEYANINTALGSFSGALNVTYYAGFYPGSNNTQLLIELQPEVQFDTDIRASYFLPDISQADYFKDICIRYCIMPFIDEATKTVTLIQFDDIKNNITNAVDWTDKVDKTNEKQIRFALNDYAQKNNISHKDDKSITAKPAGSDYVLSINNENLEPEKDLYTSPFAASEMVRRLSIIDMISINLYDATENTFSLDVEPRKCYSDKINTSISYTDGTSTVTVSTNIPITWFVSSDKSFNAGFGNNEINRNSSNLISILQGLKIVNMDIRLDLLDILNLNYMYPIKIDDSFFILSIINQFCYTSKESTEVELIKIN